MFLRIASGLFGLSLILSVEIHAQEVGARFRKIDSILKSRGDDVGFSIRNAKGKELYSYNAQKTFTPASIAKLVSTACSLDTLGPDFRFDTQWAHTGSLANGVLAGDLVIHGSGDYSFVIEDLKMIIEKLRFVYGIKEIKGKLLFDTSYFGQRSMDLYEGFDRDAGRAFSAKITAVPLNHNAFSIWIVPSNPKPQVSVMPKHAIDLNITNSLRLSKGRLNGSKTKMDFRLKQKKLKLSGRIGNRDKPRAYYRSLPDPYASFARLFKFNFEALGGKWSGSYGVRDSVTNTQTLLTHRSAPISELLTVVNKLSTNFGAEMSLLAAAEKKYSRPSTSEKAIKVLNSCISDMGVKPSDMKLFNASGLDRNSKIKPSALSLFLARLENKDYFPEYLVSMSVLGRDGTTRRRLKDHEAKARLKTGSLRGVRSIAGYLIPEPEKIYSFSMILNCKDCNARRWIQKEDEVIEQLLDMKL